jgi:hypothetical protein
MIGGISGAETMLVPLHSELCDSAQHTSLRVTMLRLLSEMITMLAGQNTDWSRNQVYLLQNLDLSQNGS